MCGRVIQSSPLARLAIVEGMDVRDSRFHNYPPRWNGAPSQELLVDSAQSPYWRGLARPAAVGPDPVLVRGPEGWAQADQRQVRDGADAADVPGCLPQAALHRPG